MSTQDRLHQVVELLRQNGCRITPQRVAILQVLVSDRSHPSIEQVYARVHDEFPMTSLATVYKTVSLLRDLGQVMELAAPGGVSRYDGVEAKPHPHLTCLQCGAILDIEVTDLPGIMASVEQASHYYVIDGRIDFWGICPNCQAKNEPSDAS